MGHGNRKKKENKNYPYNTQKQTNTTTPKPQSNPSQIVYTGAGTSKGNTNTSTGIPSSQKITADNVGTLSSGTYKPNNASSLIQGNNTPSIPALTTVLSGGVSVNKSSSPGVQTKPTVSNTVKHTQTVKLPKASSGTSNVTQATYSSTPSISIGNSTTSVTSMPKSGTVFNPVYNN